MIEPFDHAYFNWLCVKVISITSPNPFYWALFKKLYSTEFVWVVPADQNRAEDGLELRSEYLRQANLEEDPYWKNLGCSVFEVLIAFSRRAWFQTMRNPKDWFWEFLENLGLADMSDSNNPDPGIIDGILEKFIWRTYEPSGHGGLFPLKEPKRDQRQVEIWRQFFDYLEDTDRLP